MEMCDLEMKKFFQPTYGGYNNNEKKPSQFETITRELMSEHCKTYLKELFTKPEYSIATIWEYNHNTNVGGNKIQLSEHLDAMIKEKMPDMMQAMFNSVMSDAFYHFFSQIQNKVR